MSDNALIFESRESLQDFVVPEPIDNGIILQNTALPDSETFTDMMRDIEHFKKGYEACRQMCIKNVQTKVYPF